MLYETAVVPKLETKYGNQYGDDAPGDNQRPLTELGCFNGTRRSHDTLDAIKCLGWRQDSRPSHTISRSAVMKSKFRRPLASSKRSAPESRIQATLLCAAKIFDDCGDSMM